MDLRASSLMSFVPWVVMAIGSSAAGLLADGLVARGVPVLRVRKRIQTVAFLGPVVALMVLSSPGISPPLALLCMTAALGITSLG
jgi:ACS family sodium-dependent inorganic phosphate cotransporter/ACS family sodium-dependent inorganic phosphate cotransporter-like MFS transporter 9